jgi:hypothetical protein
MAHVFQPDSHSCSREEGAHHLVFMSKVQEQHREAVEKLFFLNPRQNRVRAGIIDALEKFGQPWLEEKDHSVYLRVGDKDVQTLFAFDGSEARSNPVGVVVFLRMRNSPTEIIIMHMAVHPDYALQGRRASAGLGLALIEKVREIASRIRGVERLVLCYHQGITIQVWNPKRCPMPVH